MKCTTCGKQFEGAFCPSCGATAASSIRDRKRRGPRAVKRIFSFLGTLIVIAVVIVLVLIVLDCTKFAHDPANPMIYGVMQDIRAWFPADWVTVYENIKAGATDMVTNLFGILRDGV